MKNLMKLFLILTCIMICFTSCKKVNRPHISETSDIKNSSDSIENTKENNSIYVPDDEAMYNETNSNTSSITSTAPQEPIIISVTGINLSTTNVSLTVGKSQMPIVTMIPSNATDKGEIWESSNPAIASVNGSGKITAKAVGTCAVTVKATSNQAISATVNVSVSEAQPTAPTQPIVPTQPTTPAQPTTPTLPEGVDPATAGATGETCPWCGKEIWSRNKYWNYGFTDSGLNFDSEKYCLSMEGFSIG